MMSMSVCLCERQEDIQDNSLAWMDSSVVRVGHDGLARRAGRVAGCEHGGLVAGVSRPGSLGQREQCCCF